MSVPAIRQGIAALAFAGLAVTSVAPAASASPVPAPALPLPAPVALPPLLTSPDALIANIGNATAGTGFLRDKIDRPAVVDLIRRTQAADDSTWVTQLVGFLKQMDDGGRKAIPAKYRQAFVIAAVKYGGPALAEMVKASPMILILFGVPPEVGKPFADPMASYLKTESAAFAAYMEKQPKGGKWSADDMAKFLHDKRNVPYPAAVAIAGFVVVIAN